MISMRRRRFIQFGIVGFAAIGSSSAWAAAPDDGRAFIADLAQRAIALMANKSIPEAQRRARFEEMFTSGFDIPEIGRFVLGRYWRGATPAQQTQFLKLFSDMQVLIWSSRFEGYNGEQIKVLSATPDANGATEVDTNINRSGADPLDVRWKIHKVAGQWKIVDLVVEGSSLALTQRQDIASVMHGEGGNIDGLMNKLKTKIDQLRHST